MKYCVPYFNHFKYEDKVDEVIVPFNNSLGFFRALELKTSIHHSRIILQVEKDEDFYVYREEYFPLFSELQTNHPDLKIAFLFNKYLEDYMDLYEELKKRRLNFFFASRIRDWDTFHGMIELGVSDIYIVENLGFELDLLGPVAHAAGVSIRVFGNICQNSWAPRSGLKSFFIRPEDVPFYEPYVDVIEFFGVQKHEQEVMYKVYAIDKKWFGNLAEIIIGLNMDLDSRCLVAAFAPSRISCGKKCLKGKPCNICDRILELSQTLQDNEMMITH